MQKDGTKKAKTALHHYKYRKKSLNKERKGYINKVHVLLISLVWRWTRVYNSKRVSCLIDDANSSFELTRRSPPVRYAKTMCETDEKDDYEFLFHNCILFTSELQIISLLSDFECGQGSA